MKHDPMCKINMSCAVLHEDGICPGPYGKCDCGAESALPQEQPKEKIDLGYGSKPIIRSDGSLVKVGELEVGAEYDVDRTTVVIKEKVSPSQPNEQWERIEKELFFQKGYQHEECADYWIERIALARSQERQLLREKVEEMKKGILKKARIVDYADRTEYDFAAETLDDLLDYLNTEKEI